MSWCLYGCLFLLIGSAADLTVSWVPGVGRFTGSAAREVGIVLFKNCLTKITAFYFSLVYFLCASELFPSFVVLPTTLLKEIMLCFLCVLNRSSRLSTLAKALSPSYLRVGGDAADFLIFHEHINPSQFDRHKCNAELDRRNFSTFYMTG
jgi:hypothetical protein